MGHEDELAAVLGHEIGHIALDQCAARLREAMQKHNVTARQFDQLSIEEFGAPYGKKGELEADREGMRLAVAAGYSPSAMVNLLETFQLLFRDSKPAERTDSPSLEERVQQAKEEIQRNKWKNAADQKPLNLP
jgi:predicted Zn-dependent protease